MGEGGGRSGEMCCHLPCCVSRKSVEAGGYACLGVGGGGGGGRSGEMCCYLPCCVSRKSVIRRV